MKIRLITVIWGEAFTDLFLRLAARTLLADGNIPALAREADVTYTIYTTAQDAARLRESPIVRRLEAVVPMRYSIFRLEEIDSSHFGSHSDLWQRGIELARRNDETAFFLMPDILYADGTLARWFGRLRAGKKAVYTPGPQVVLETVLDEIEARFPVEAGDVVGLGEREVRDLLFRHLHPLAATMLRDSPRRILHPEHDIRALPGRGMVVRAFTSQPLCVTPRHFLSLQSFNPVDHLDDIAYEPCTVVSAEPLLKHLGWYYRPWSLDETRLSNLGGWWDYFGTPGNAAESAHAYRIAIDDTELETEADRAVATGRFFRTQMLAARGIYRMHQRLVAMGNQRAASILATAHYAARLRRRLPVGPGATLMVPVDQALEGEAWTRLAGHLGPGREDAFAALIANHVIPAGSKATLAGIPVNKAIRHARIISGPAFVGEFTIYEIDRVLWTEGAEPDAVAPEPEPSSGQADVDGKECLRRKPGTPRGIERFILGRQPLTPWALRSPLHRLVFLLLHVPVIEPIVALLVPVYFRTQLREFARHIYRRLSGRPRFAMVLLLLRQFLAVARQRGLREALAAAARRLGNRGGFPGRVAAFGIDFTVRAGGALRKDGPRTFAGRIWRTSRRLGLAAVMSSRPGLPEAERRELVGARVLVGLGGMAEVFDHYEDTVLDDRLRSAPRSLLRDLVVDGADARKRALEILDALALRYPRVADLCLERGWAALDAGDATAAKNWFERATKAPRTSGPGGLPAPQGHAWAALAVLHRDAGDSAQALRCYREAVERLPDRSVLRVAYADMLRQSGEVAAAVDQYTAAMGYEGPVWAFPRLPRDIRVLASEGEQLSVLCRVKKPVPQAAQ